MQVLIYPGKLYQGLSVKSCDLYCKFSGLIRKQPSKETSYFTISVWRVVFFFFVLLLLRAETSELC